MRRRSTTTLITLIGIVVMAVSAAVAILGGGVFWHPAVLIEIGQRGNDVAFSFSMETRSLWRWSPQPVGVRTVLVWEDRSLREGERSELIWKIVANKDAGNALTDVAYGVVPRGFVQANPAQGPPPPLMSGRTYAVTAIGAQQGWGTKLFELGAADNRPQAVPWNR